MPLPEKALIARIRESRQRYKGAVKIGIGDDCAALRLAPGHEMLVTTDFTLEGVHFRRPWHGPEVVGRRCLTRGLSDIAAMGGKPSAALLSLALPRDLPQKWVNGFLKGLLSLAGEFKVPLAGGDIAESPNGILADIIVLGSVPKGKAILRSGAKASDRIYVTGELGGSSAALEALLAGEQIRPKQFPRHFHPVPRIVLGRFLRERGLASAMIDLSDGLSTDLAHLCEESGVGAEIQADALPLAQVGKHAGKVGLRNALHGGEDYELLFTASSESHVPRRIAGVPVTLIGRVRRERNVLLKQNRRPPSELRPQGWQHFAR